MRHLALAGLLLLLCSPGAHAQEPSVELHTPRPFGYFIGDVIHHLIVAEVPAPYRLRRASLPAPQALAYWLDLVAIDVEAEEGGDINRYVIDLSYQTFYAPLATASREIPSFPIAFANGDDVIERRVPAWRFMASSLRGMERRVTGEAFIRPDVVPGEIDEGPYRNATVAFAVATVLSLALLLHHRALWPFGTRPGRPFTAAARRVRRERGQGEQPYRTRLLALHRAFDEKGAGRVFAEDLPAFLARFPAFAPLADDIGRFFAASRSVFFAGDTESAMAELAPDEVEVLAGRLARAERGGG